MQLSHCLFQNFISKYNLHLHTQNNADTMLQKLPYHVGLAHDLKSHLELVF